MIQIDETNIRKVILHRLNSDGYESVFSNQLILASDELEEKVLKNIFLKPFVSHATTFEFSHEIKLEFNVLFNLSKSIQEKEDFVDSSIEIAKHLISTSKHPNIKNGDLFIAHFDKIRLDNVQYEGIGIYKFEDKESFIETNVHGKEISMTFRKGLGSKKPDKACLIVFTEEPYTLFVIDNNSNETDYWQHDFIKHRSKNDYVNNTNNYMTMAKNFITEQITDDFEVSKADQIDLLNRSVQYFKSHEAFDKPEFEKEVFHDPNVIESFRKYDETYRETHQVELEENFPISIQAVKKQAKIFKSVLKLDKNFHIYIHGDKELIEQGMDSDGRKFYKIYYEEEN